MDLLSLLLSAAALLGVSDRPPAVTAAARPRPSYQMVHVRRPLWLRSSPAGRRRLRIGTRTEFGTATTLSVTTRRGRWLAVTHPDLPNGARGWVRADDRRLKLGRTRWSLHADLSARRLELRRDDQQVRQIKVAVGRPSSPTPTGRFAVTDKLAGARFGSYYGCCILAISGTQSRLPAGWSGGNRLAVHGTDLPASIGHASSAGCLRAADRALRSLMRTVPVGTPVLINP